MSDTVDNVLDAVNESEPADDVVVEEAPEEVASDSETEAAEPEPVVEPEPEPVAGPEPVASEAAEPEPVVEPEPVSTQEVVQNVQEILSSTETNVTVDNSELENRVKVLEERLENLEEELLRTRVSIRDSKGPDDLRRRFNDV